MSDAADPGPEPGPESGDAFPPEQYPFSFAPVFIRQAKAVVSWSTKSGCSHVVLWAFRHEGCLPQASQRRELPHGYRIRVYQKQPWFKAWIRNLRREGGRDRTLIRVTRDPRKRLVSIFRHACRFPFLHAPAREMLGFDPAVEGLSLADLDAVLEGLSPGAPTTDPHGLDPHVRGQHTPLWAFDFDRVITLNMDELPLNPGLNAIERSLGLPETDFDIPAFRNLREIHYARPRAFGRGTPIETHRFRPEETKAFPKAQILASPLLERMARRHYAADYAGVASGDTAGELFQSPVRVAR